MSQSKFLAFDFGAESGRAIIGIIENDKLRLEEIHRFTNRQVKIHGRIHWDILNLFDELKKGIFIAIEKDHSDILSIGIDTWGVDFGLIDRSGQLIGNPVAYRDNRTVGMMEKAFTKLPKEEIYRHTGIQFMQLNTIYQLLSLVETNDPQLEIADTLLFMPDLFNYLLTGKKTAEYTIASTSQLMDANNRKWSESLFKQLKLPLHIMPPIVDSGTIVGPLLDSICSETGIKSVNVIAPAGHDTACAVAAIPVRGTNWAYLSSGTWSLLGIENDKPIINEQALKFGFTNEGGVNGKIRFLINIMGMWIFERCRDKWIQNRQNVDYKTLINEASNAKAFKCILNPDDAIFINPENMLSAISDFCKKTDQPVPENKGEYVRCIFESLAFKYKSSVEKINSIRSSSIERLHIVGGGSKNEMLNQFIANAINIPVIAGPSEGTAIGNILLQAISNGVIENIDEGRQIISNSFELQHFEPSDSDEWNKYYEQKKYLFH